MARITIKKVKTGYAVTQTTKNYFTKNKPVRNIIQIVPTKTKANILAKQLRYLVR